MLHWAYPTTCISHRPYLDLLVQATGPAAGLLDPPLLGENNPEEPMGAAGGPAARPVTNLVEVDSPLSEPPEHPKPRSPLL